MRVWIPMLLVSLHLFPVLVSASSLEEASDLFRRQEYEQARVGFEALAAEDASNPEAQYYLGRLDLIDNNLDGALKHFERAIDLGPERSDYHLWYAKTLMRRMPTNGLVGKMRDGMKMMKAMSRAVEVDPENLEARMTRFRVLARSHRHGPIGEGDVLAEIHAICERDSAMGHLAWGEFHEIMERYEDADPAYRKARAMKPEDETIALSYAGFLRDVGRFQEAVAIYEDLLASDAGHRRAGFGLGLTLLLADEHPERAPGVLARANGRPSPDGLPTDAMLHWTLGVTYARLGDDGRAREEWKTAERLDRGIGKIVEASPALSKIESSIESR